MCNTLLSHFAHFQFLAHSSGRPVLFSASLQECQAFSFALFFVSQPSRDVTLSVKLRRNNRSSGRECGWQTPPTNRLGSGPSWGNGSVPQLVRSIMMISHGLRVSAIADAQGFSLWMQFSTVRAIPLRVPSIPHLWDVFTDQQILLACTSDPLVRKFPFAM